MGTALTPWTRESAREWIVRRAPAMLPAFDACAARLDREPPGAVIAYADNADFAGGWLAAASALIPVWCANPKWSPEQRAEAEAQIPTGTPVFPEVSSSLLPKAGFRAESGSIFIPTGGTGGRVRFVRHSPATLSAAVSGFSRYAGDRLLRTGRPERLHAVQAPPCFHVSGLMPVVRAWLTDGTVIFAPPSFRETDALPEIPTGDDGLRVVSLVGAQLYRLLMRDDGARWLRLSGMTLLGGAAADPALLARARDAGIPVGVSYGLTESAALAALFPPERFLNGETPSGESLPHIHISITDEGRVALCGESLAEDAPRDAEGRFVTGDDGFLDPEGRLVVTGRADRIFVSGGEKIDPALIEAAILSTGLVREVFVVGEPDAEWGRRATAVCLSTVTESELRARLAAKLTGHLLPKRIVRVGESLMTGHGKVDLVRLREVLSAHRTPDRQT